MTDQPQLFAKDDVAAVQAIDDEAAAEFMKGSPSTADMAWRFGVLATAVAGLMKPPGKPPEEPTQQPEAILVVKK